MLAYLDCLSGLAGDMLVASLLGAGIDYDQFRNILHGLNLPEFETELTTVKRSAIAANLFTVRTKPTHHHRSLSDILEIIASSQLSDRVKNDATRIFQKLGRAESKVHDCAIDEIHFHEVGAVDSIVDIVSACICLELLNIDELLFPALPVGSGTVEMAHGILPVPAPATAELLIGYQVYQAGEGEHTTPTGAAIVTSLGIQVAGVPELSVKAVGYGAGTRTIGRSPNILRVIVGERAGAGQLQMDQVGVLSCQVDDMTGEQLGLLAEQLRDAGALDVVYIPIYMKKGRPAVMLEVIARPCDVDRLAEQILRSSSSFGVRHRRVDRYKLARETITVQLAAGPVRVKLGSLAGKVVQVSPEYEDCRLAASGSQAKLDDIHRQAVAEACRQIKINGKKD